MEDEGEHNNFDIAPTAGSILVAVTLISYIITQHS